MYRQHFSMQVPQWAVLCLLATSCATTKNDQALQDHYDTLEQQQLSELQSEEQARKLDLLRPATQPGINELQEQDRDRRYQQALEKAENRRGKLDFGFDDADSESATDENTGWQAGVLAHPVSGEPACMINSKASQVQHGELETSVQLVIDKNAIYLRTDTTLDGQAEAAGFSVDGGEFFPVESYLNELTGSLVDRYQTLLIQLALGQQLRVSFRYLPQLETQANYVVRLSLDGFNAELRKMNSCTTH